MDNDHLDKLRRQHRKWLRRRGLLDRPWLIFGSAPDPTLPMELAQRCARIDINNAGRTADALGLGAADLTIRTEAKPWAEHPDLRTRAMLWVHPGSLLRMRWHIFRKTKARVGALRRWSREEREAIVDEIVGKPLGGVGDLGKATTGVAAVCYGLFVGVPEIYICGFSISSGHSYDERNRARKQIEEDLFAFEQLRARPQLWTTEPALSEQVGLRLYGRD